MTFRGLAIVVLLLLALAADGAVTAFIGVNVVPMDAERVLMGQTVIVRDDRVEAIGPVDEVVVPEDAQVIYGRGRWLLPGLTDMHVHIRAVDLPRYVENGITTVRDLAGVETVVAIAKQRPFGPRIYVSSKLLAGPAAQSFFSLSVMYAEDAQMIVDRELARGVDSIKVYDDLRLDVYDALINAARARGVKVAGHVTRFVDIHHAISTLNSIEHLSGYPLGNAARNRELAIESRDVGVWNCPTMVVFSQWVTRNFSPTERQRLLDDRRDMVRALDEANAPLLAGTDSGYLVPAGIALHDELDELFAAGLTRFEVLSAATRSPGLYLGDPSLGVIAPGAHADLVLVNANPLENLTTLRTPAGVMLNGRWIAYDQRRRSTRH